MVRRANRILDDYTESQARKIGQNNSQKGLAACGTVDNIVDDGIEDSESKLRSGKFNAFIQ
jgi:hypothetical protein